MTNTLIIHLLRLHNKCKVIVLENETKKKKKFWKPLSKYDQLLWTQSNYLYFSEGKTPIKFNSRWRKSRQLRFKVARNVIADIKKDAEIPLVKSVRLNMIGVTVSRAAPGLGCPHCLCVSASWRAHKVPTIPAMAFTFTRHLHPLIPLKRHKRRTRKSCQASSSLFSLGIRTRCVARAAYLSRKFGRYSPLES